MCSGKSQWIVVWGVSAGLFLANQMVHRQHWHKSYVPAPACCTPETPISPPTHDGTAIQRTAGAACGASHARYAAGHDPLRRRQPGEGEAFYVR